jgi:methionyl-tRNA formyltransferase
MNIAYFGYRQWAEEILENIKEKSSASIDSFTVSNSEYLNKKTTIIDPRNLSSELTGKYDVSFFYGWSWIVPEEVLESTLPVCLHPSPLPKYRGGSPLQHQIINGESDSAVTLFKMGSGIDDGPIIKQTPFSLEGTLDNIFDRMVEVGTETSLELISNYQQGILEMKNQDESLATNYKRRKPAQSEITKDMLDSYSAKQMYNFIRALQSPYPPAYITQPDGSKSYFILSSDK